MNKQEKIVSMFDEIAKSYDLANRVLSLGIDIRWRKSACQNAFRLYQKDNLRILDVACGTGDMGKFWLEVANKESIKIESIIGIDPSKEMLEIAKKKLPNIEFIKAEAKEIPFSDFSFDMLSISYGIRNVVEREVALREFFRVLKKDGLLVILEFTKNEDEKWHEKLMRFYVKKALPFIGGLVSRNYDAYKYLPDSIDNFLTTTMLANELTKIGFKIELIKGQSGRISTLLIGRKT